MINIFWYVCCNLKIVIFVKKIGIICIMVFINFLLEVKVEVIIEGNKIISRIKMRLNRNIKVIIILKYFFIFFWFL